MAPSIVPSQDSFSDDHSADALRSETGKPPTPPTGEDVLDPETMDRGTLEKRILGAQRRSKMPGAEGKKAQMECSKLNAVFKRRFKGATKRFWDKPPSLPAREAK